MKNADFELIREEKSMNEKDVVEVVRCKNCVKTDGEEEKNGTVFCTIHKKYLFKDDFCSYGKSNLIEEKKE